MLPWRQSHRGALTIQRIFSKSFLQSSARLTNAPSSLKMAEAPMRSDGIIFLLQQRRRNVSEERSFLWNFQPIREEYSQPSPCSRLWWRRQEQERYKKPRPWHQMIIFLFYYLFTSVDATLSETLFLGLMSLFLRWTWYIFSAATQDLGLSSGGMVTPYSQPDSQRHTDCVTNSISKFL